MYHISLVHSSVEGQLVYFQNLAIIANTAANNMAEQLPVKSAVKTLGI